MTRAQPRSESDQQFEERITALLDNPSYADHPLRLALAELLERSKAQQQRLERIIKISDRYQSLFHEHVFDLSRRYDRQVRSLTRNVRQVDQHLEAMEQRNDALQLSATHDILTGVPNRRLISERCRAEDARTTRYGSTYSLALIDVDNFKRINDSYGHTTGDQVLVELAAVLKSCVREFDLCARWGGEEFLALFVDTGLETAEIIAQRILDMVRHLRVKAGSEELSLTVSIGVAQHAPSELYTNTFARADQALYEAKHSGRDCYKTSAPPPVASA
ncbi:diguanylate cyclase [Cyanobium sp. PCC 7001]|uniref:biofilm regulation diguanylate cyclase SiaD n=1 Tax=Cyanobium sp. PCC 7001 TaxID=180281 RepID=UPI0001805BEF|nr:biofilm regulation diguanylate cyclase SiaD [Cyanobium sp. PCC 7001]EDY39179.1 diguanylate cyclase [Cyanobium sp. PCC 7001]